MRERKYRAFHKKAKEMVYFDIEKFLKDQFLALHFFQLMKGNHPEAGFLEDFTGLKDKNGVEVWEGDLLKGYRVVDAVEFKDGCFIVGDVTVDMALYSGSIVLGNIHENPELLMN